MAWIELHDTLPDHPKTIASSTALNIDKDMLIGKLARLWTWSINNRENGFIADYEMPTVSEVMRWTRKPEQLFSALCKVPTSYTTGFLEKVDGGYVIHDWDERVSMLREVREKTRAETRKRVAKHREKKRLLQSEETAHDVTDCNALHGSYVTPHVTQSNAATVPNRTLEEEEDNAHVRESSEDAPPDIVAYCQSNFPAMNAKSLDELRDFMRDGMTAELIKLAVDKTRANGSFAWGYASRILDDWVVKGVRTLEAAETLSQQHKARGQAQPTPDTRSDWMPKLAE